MKNRIVLIPAYRPENNFINLIKKLIQHDFIIIVVDDGSGKEYKQIFDATSKYAKIISYKENKGKGYAIKEGLKYIKDKYKTYIVITMDCDLQHSVNDAIKLSKISEKEDNVLLLGKRIRNKNTPLRSRIGNSITRYIFKIITKKDIYDTQTGLRVFTNQIIDILINTKGERYEYEMNVLLNCIKENIEIKEVEVQTIYINNNHSSHFKAIKDSYLIYKNIIQYKREERKHVRK